METLKSNQVAEIKIIYKTKVPAKNRRKVISSKQCYKLLLENWDMDTIELFEEGKALFLNNANQVICLYEISKGGSTGTVMDVRLILTAAMKVNASTIILSHNHPSGTTAPSQADIEITNRIKEAGKLLGILLIDHLIITGDAYYSFADEGAI